MKILKIWKSKLVIAGIVLLFFLCMQITVSASESKSVDPSKVELPLSVPVQDTDYEELDPTQILNMAGLLPDASQVTALGQVPKGAGSVIESETSGAVKTPEGKEFYIIQTKDEETFFLVIDHAKASDNVYFLSQINGSDLTGSKTNQVEAETDNSFLDKDKEQVPPKAENKDEVPEGVEESSKEIPVDSPKTEKSGGAFFFVLLIAIVFGVGYYAKIYKPKQKVLDDALDFESDFEGVQDDYFEEGEEENEFEEDEEEEEEDEPEEEWEEPVVEKKKRKPVVQEKRPTSKEKPISKEKPTVVQKEQPKTSKIGIVFNVLAKFVFGFILLGLVSLGLTVLTNESLRNMIMETVKNYF